MVRESKSSGFTIVEIAVVIVVIAILAVVTVASFDSIQARTHASVTASNLETYQGAIEQIYQDTGKYPSTQGRITCLGEVSESNGCSANLSVSGAGCGGEGTLGGAWLSNESLNEVFRKYIDDIPDPSTLTSVKTSQTVQTEEGSCTVSYNSDGSLGYRSVQAITIRDGVAYMTIRVLTDDERWNRDAYAITYALPGKMDCYSKNNMQGYDETFDVTTCVTYGGKVIYE